jgi:hypothetical protein
LGIFGEPHQFRKFLATIDKAVPEGLDIHLICDNYGTHKTPAIKTWLARHPRIHMHFTPTGSSCPILALASVPRLKSWRYIWLGNRGFPRRSLSI